MSDEAEFSDAIDPTSLFEIVKSLPHPAAILNAAGAAIFENCAFRSLRHRAVPAVPVEDFFSTLSPFERAEVEQMAGDNRASQSRYYKLDWHLPGASPAKHLAELTRLTNGESVVGILCQITVDQSDQRPRLRYLTENLDLGVWDYNLQTGVFTASKTWHDLRGLAADHEIDVTNDDWLNSIHPDDRNHVSSALHGQKESGEASFVTQYRHIHADGHWIWILCRASVVECDSNGRPLRIIGTDTDISDAVKSQESINRLAEKLKLAVEASGMGIWEFNPATNNIHWDDRMLEIYGITDGENERSGNIWETYLHEGDYDETVAYAEECKRLNRDFKRDYRIVTPDGSTRYVRSMARAVSTPSSETKLIGVNIDITEDYQRAQELELARFEAEQANLAKSNFLANMSHELRTPLNAVMGFSETMSLEALGAIPPVYREYANHINSSAKHLLSMIQQLLDLSRIEAGKMELSVDDVPLAALVEEVVQIVASAHDRPLTDFVIETGSLDVMLRADARVMRQTLINVVGNAAKFSDAGSVVTIAGRLLADSIQISVRDRGIGIAAKDIDSIFEPYNRSSSQAAQTRSGTGLGLPIARALIEAHGGSLVLDSEVNVGSTLTISLPRKRVAGPSIEFDERSTG